MKLSAPLHTLKRRARDLKRDRKLTLTQALDAVARQEGYGSWSLLHARAERDLLPRCYDALLGYLNPGDLVLVGGRPQHGKTRFALGLMAQAIRERRVRCGVFSLDFAEHALRAKLTRLRGDDALAPLCAIDCSDAIHAAHIIRAAQPWVGEGSVVVVDYLQLLDQDRTTPPLQAQVEALRAWAHTQRCIVVCISQLNRRVEGRADPRPSIADVHLPNPLDLGLFNKHILLHRPSPDAPHVEVTLAGHRDHRFTARLDTIDP